MGRTLSPGRRLLAVFCGGFFGTLARALLSMMLQSRFGNGWPYDILLINLTGAFLLAFFTTLADATFLIGPTRRLFINVGFLGAYTTFSSLALGDILLFSKSMLFLALVYLMCSFAGGLLAVWLGDWVAQRIIRRFMVLRVHVVPSTNKEVFTRKVDVMEHEEDSLQDETMAG